MKSVSIQSAVAANKSQWQDVIPKLLFLKSGLISYGNVLLSESDGEGSE